MASWTAGLIGRSPDNFPSYVSGLAMDPALFERIRPGFGENIRRYYRSMRSRDAFVAHTVTNPQGWRMASPGQADATPSPTLRVVDETDRGIVIDGLKMLGTSAVFCHETWCGNLQPVPADRPAEAITCVVPLNAPGVSIWSRMRLTPGSADERDAPLAARFDESDSAVLFERVHVPWENVFCIGDTELSRAIYFRTPGHAMANHQANVRFLEKLKLLVGLARRIVEANNALAVPAVQSTLGRLAAMQATLEGLIMGAVGCGEAWMPGYHTVNRRYVYAALHWCTNEHARIVDAIRELAGAGIFQMPAEASVLDDAALAATFERYWATPGQTAAHRMRLFRLAWELLGSAFAGRHAQYEKFYAGPGFVMDAYSYTTAPWSEWTAIVDRLLAEVR